FSMFFFFFFNWLVMFPHVDRLQHSWWEFSLLPQRFGICRSSRSDSGSLGPNYEEREFKFHCGSVCNILGGNLASVHSTSASSSDIWIGLHEAIEESTFFWTDGSAVDFTNFNSDNAKNNTVFYIYKALRSIRPI
uniref:C-type lectin domain-containing protein n=1 Tax=Hippocampus comes TaxID=109280 RepID=A0A3Q3D5Q2_HIPCM